MPPFAMYRLSVRAKHLSMAVSSHNFAHVTHRRLRRSRLSLTAHANVGHQTKACCWLRHSSSQYTKTYYNNNTTGHFRAAHTRVSRNSWLAAPRQAGLKGATTLTWRLSKCLCVCAPSSACHGVMLSPHQRQVIASLCLSRGESARRTWYERSLAELWRWQHLHHVMMVDAMRASDRFVDDVVVVLCGVTCKGAVT